SARSVDLPAPFGPTSASTSPARTSTSTGSSATCDPYRRLTALAASREGTRCGASPAALAPGQPRAPLLLSRRVVGARRGAGPGRGLDLHLDGPRPRAPPFEHEPLREELPHRARRGEQRERDQHTREAVDLAARE